jgi:hypothetical protein
VKKVKPGRLRGRGEYEIDRAIALPLAMALIYATTEKAPAGRVE